MRKIGSPRIVIEIDTENNSYLTDFEHVSVPVVYAVLRNLINRIESGEMFDGEVDIEDADGNSVSGDDAKRVIRNLKQELDGLNPEEEEGSGGISNICTDKPRGSKSN